MGMITILIFYVALVRFTASALVAITKPS